MFSLSIIWLWLAGLIFLIAGLFVCRRELASSRGLEKLIVLGPVFFAASLAVFGAEHLVSAPVIMQLVPAWMPARLFWAYFVGVALLIAATGLVLRKQVRLSATLLGVLFLLFVVLIHIPNVTARPDRLFWALALRDLAFAAGACALAGSRTKQPSVRTALIIGGRLCLAIPVVFFAVQHFLHPEFAPGVPLAKVTPAWVPLRPVWGYLTGAVLLIAGAALLVDKKARTAAASIGLIMTILTLLLYIPILAMASQAAQMIEGINYVADTLLFAGAALLVAGALRKDAPFAG
jgi:uncharacterized membrane protein